MTDFQSILDMPLGEVEAPKPLPRGTYLFVVAGPPTFTKVGKDQTDAADFALKVLQATEDVQADDLQTYGEPVMGKSMRARFFLTKDAAKRLDDFLHISLGIEGAMKLREAIALAPGRQCYGVVEWTPSADGQRMFANLKSTSKV
jgi:hypothetical protein